MKKKVFSLLFVVCCMVFFSSCGVKSSSSSLSNEKNDQVIKVATALESSEEMLALADKIAKQDGYSIESVRVNDNVQYNTLLKDKEVDANLSQHEPYMEGYNKANKTDFVILQKIYDAKVGFYSKDYKNIEDIPNDGKVAVPNDASNQGRALAILADKGLIKLKEGVGFDGTVKDIEENPKNFKFVEIDLLNLASAYDEKNMVLVYNYPTYLTKIGLTPEDAIFLETPNDNHFAISVVTRKDEVDSKKIQVLKKAIASDEVRDYLQKEHSESLVPSF